MNHKLIEDFWLCELGLRFYWLFKFTGKLVIITEFTGKWEKNGKNKNPTNIMIYQFK